MKEAPGQAERRLHSLRQRISNIKKTIPRTKSKAIAREGRAASLNSGEDKRVYLDIF